MSTKKLINKINEAKAKLASLRETKQQPKGFGLLSLMESELDKAELVLAVKGISDELQQIAEKVAKIEAEEIMPIIDSLKASFGPDLSQSFNSVASDSLRSLVEAIKSAKDAIGNEILRLEGAADGSTMNDMSMADEPAAEPAPEMGGDAGADMDMDMSADTGAGDMDLGAEMGGDDMGMDDAGGDDLDMSYDAPDVDPAAGRAKKESAEFRNASNPDKFVFEAVVARIRDGSNGVEAVKMVAENLGLDLSDVVEIVSENRKKK